MVQIKIRLKIRQCVAFSFMALGACLPVVAHAEPIKIYAAGSLVGPLKEMISASGMSADAFASPVFGPAGLLAERLGRGESADLFLSADQAKPRQLMMQGKAMNAVPFARNKLCLLSKDAMPKDAQSLVDALSSNSLRLATSTPLADPGGDYAWSIFDRANVLRAGVGQALKAKSLQLIGSPTAMTPVAGKTASASIFLADKADALIYYCSGQADTLRDVPGLTSMQLPADLDVTAVYGMAVMSDKPDALRLALFIVSDAGQSILVKHGLLPVLGTSD